VDPFEEKCVADYLEERDVPLDEFREKLHALLADRTKLLELAMEMLEIAEMPPDVLIDNVIREADNIRWELESDEDSA
jgi:hypothetical protein